MNINKNKIIALYIIWAFLHLILFLTSGNFLTRYDSDFFPFPILKTNEINTYLYLIYNEIDYNESIIAPSYDEFFKRLQKDDNIRILYHAIKNRIDLPDSIVFFNKMKESINNYGRQKYYTKYKFFPDKYDQYDYSEFIIYSILPLVLIYFKKFWSLK